MSLVDLVSLLAKYGVAGIIIAVLMSVVIILYAQLLKSHSQLVKSLADTTARADRYEAQVKDLNNDIQIYLALGVRAKRVIGEAAAEMRVINDGIVSAG